MEEAQQSFDDFSVEMGDYEVKKTGKFDRMWKVGPGGTAFQAPIIVDDTIYFGSCNQNVYAVDIKTGEQIWKFRTEDMITESSPIYSDGKIYIGSFDHNLYCLDAKTGELVWKYKTQGEIYSSACVYDGKVYFGSRDRILHCIDAGTGRLMWKFETQDEIVAPPSAHEGKILFGCMDHNFYATDSETGRLVWKFTTQGELHGMSPPPVHNGTVYFGSFDNNLYAVDVNTGRMKWKFRTGIYGNGVLPVLHNDVIYHASRDGFVYAITLEGKQIWRFSTKHNICVPIVHDEKLFFGSEDRFLYCLSLDGRLLWKKEFESIIFIRPVAKDNVVYFTCWDCNVYALDIDTQKVLWKFRMSGSPSYLPPPYESFEMSMKIDENTVEDGVRKKYDFDLADENDNLSTYKSRITYQVSTQYASKGKYQIDSDEEEF